MKLIIPILTIFFSAIFTQDRSLIFSTGSPNGTEGYTIEWDDTSGQSVSDRIYISGNMVLEALRIYAQANTEPAMAKIILQADNEGIPGEEIYSWDIDVAEENHGSNSILIVTTFRWIYVCIINSI